MANAKKRWLLDYQLDREKKREYIRQHVEAEGLKTSDLMKKIQHDKKMEIPFLDDVTMTELENFVDELKHETNLKASEEVDQIDSNQKNENGKNQEISDTNSVTALFDKLQAKEDQELDDSVSSVRSSNSFRSMSTKKSKLTVLNQKAYAQIYVSDVYQLITSKVGNSVRGQSLMIVMKTFPFNWKVQRLDIDFVTLRHYLVRKYP